MKTPSRRRFLTSWFALGGLAGPLACLSAGCGKEETLAPRMSDAGVPPDPKKESGGDPPYVRLHRSGELKERGEALWQRMTPCDLCPRECGSDRLDGERGFCHATSELKIASYHPHFGEEPPLVGRGGSGTVFFSHCSLRCVFCINYDISMEGRGSARSIDELAAMMLSLQAMGCHNINVVTPSHYSPHILLALDLACGRGLRLPLVYNTCGWEQMDVLQLLDGVVDVYLADYKYDCGEMALKYSTSVPPDEAFLEAEIGERYTSTEVYPERTREALLEMHRQVGVAKPAEDGLIHRGLMIRHLVMPSGVGGSEEVIRWIAAHLPKDTYLNIMAQYTPMYKAFDYPEIARRITADEYRSAVEAAKEAGLTNLDIQGYRSLPW